MAFLSAIEESLDEKNQPIRVLFGNDEGGVFGTEHLSDLLWALESLVWSPDLMPRVTHVLARLDAIDSEPRRYSNRPANSLREIHLLWAPQTFATLDQRLRAIDLIRKQTSDAAWKLMLGILPRGHGTSTPSPMPRWRDFTVDNVEVVTWDLIGRGAAAITKRLLVDVGVDSTRWSSLLDRFSDLAPDLEVGIAALEMAEREITDAADRAVLCKNLRQLLHQHRQFADTEWSFSNNVLDRIETIYERFAPLDPLQRTAWLFEPSVALPRPSTEGWEVEQRDVDATRRLAAQTLFSEDGATSILALARLVGAPGYIGKALYDAGLPKTDLDELLESALRSDNDRERELAHGLISSAFYDQKELWAEALLAKAKKEAWGKTALMTIFRALPAQRWTWTQVANAGAEIENYYWREVQVYWHEDSDDVSFAIRKLISIGRARQSLSLAARGGQVHLPSDLLVEVLVVAARQPFQSDRDHNEATMFQYYVAEILKLLDDRSDVAMDTLVTLEWTYLPLLEHSRRPAKFLLKALSEQPALFIQMLRPLQQGSQGERRKRRYRSRIGGFGASQCHCESGVQAPRALEHPARYP